jgi:hypothetical protein
MKNKKYESYTHTVKQMKQEHDIYPTKKKKRAQQYNTLDIHDTYMTYILAYKLLHFFFKFYKVRFQCVHNFIFIPQSRHLFVAFVRRRHCLSVSFVPGVVPQYWAGWHWHSTRRPSATCVPCSSVCWVEYEH